MSATKATFCCMLAFFLASCGQVVKESLTTPATGFDQQSACATTKTIVVLPFADYSATDGDMEQSFKRNLAVMEALTDQLTAKGFRLPVYEDMVHYLVKNEIIQMGTNSRSTHPTQTSSIENELISGEWSEAMKNELRNQIKLQNKSKPQTTQGLDQKTIARLGREFKADYVLRGRLIKYSYENENTWHPLKKGVLPVFFGVTDRFMFGFADSELYDTVDGMAVGAGIGAGIGNSLDTPYSPATADYTNLNSLTWGAVGAGAAYLAKQGGKTKQAVVHLRIWVQDSSTGEVVWTNRAEVEVAPQSIYADRNEEKLFHTAVNQAVGALVEDFWMKSAVMM